MQVEIIVHSIKVRARSTIECGSFEGIFSEGVGNIEEDGLLRGKGSFFVGLVERIIVVTVAVDIIRIDFFEILLETDGKESATSTVGIKLACIIPVRLYLRVNK